LKIIVKRNFNQLFEAAQVAEVRQVSATGSSKYSVSVVNSDGNGKRVALSKALFEKLQLEGSVCMLPLAEENVLLLAKEMPFPSTSKIELTSKKDPRIIYNADVVALLVDTFGLDYTNCTSKSFNQIEFEEHEGVTFAAVTMVASGGSDD
jgi:hypothetical protein